MRHFITTKDFSKSEIIKLFEEAKDFLDEKPRTFLEGKSITTIFFENSTRTLSSFESATRRLGARVLRLDVSRSSSSKGETLYDTVANLDAMSPNAIIIRHAHSGVPLILAKHTHCPIINAGDGKHSHPTQALLDLFTIYNHFNGKVEGKKICIVGDIKNSRVAASNIELLTRFNLDIVLVAPPHFMPHTSLKKFYQFNKNIIENSDIIMSLRTQTERHNKTVYASLQDYANDFCIQKNLIENKKLILLHPGPVNRNIDISDEIMKDERTLVLKQVKNGIAIRMAVLKKLILENKG
ncbi:aspartate carbamoyltransferase catalytic subunit [Campylobacter sp. VicNov18]|uniref:aspartate carbamoyltransferase catalytic subunit n=1 Tax=Campylobacter bilis TaxID=2691918 RepID=UPI00130DB7AD|nr:aspartate carbamoyltransferase catalytic subunit [Campylobacter bilis]MPV63659.1 aspartate carbamoyltransferase catalytic subunit [Campylobacter hepaticus]MBM0637160.1 aspartate carbamoyltransferase catalytic subunit [Campylobacter bilis]MCC8277876.1 aspartate carbamoyltransferase catalytic subunit [Campylobacter bilis]MCC8298807.1 aspartate carbamoyltransferase catalytic subunit [Campylobacter bilis]MCC8300786.1 aspartate carbamoyltransferase catalytic subunit [Campylobacter bilis]